eukprot:scaffold11205_cov101-Isochrysis_galbana.AAC.3
MSIPSCAGPEDKEQGRSAAAGPRGRRHRARQRRVAGGGLSGRRRQAVTLAQQRVESAGAPGVGRSAPTEKGSCRPNARRCRISADTAGGYSASTDSPAPSIVAAAAAAARADAPPPNTSGGAGEAGGAPKAAEGRSAC